MMRTNRRAILIVVAIVVGSQIARLVVQNRKAELTAHEMKSSMYGAFAIQDQLKIFRQAHGAYPSSLQQLGMREDEILGFMYSTNTNGYSLGYRGANYETAPRRWSGN